MTTIGTKLAAVALVLCTVGPAYAGKGGSAQLIQQAVASGSTDAIIAEVERTESLLCADCVNIVTALTEDSRYPVRQVAAWWFAKRPGSNKIMVAQMKDDMALDSIHVRNAADYLGTVKQYDALPLLRSAMTRGLTTEAKLAVVRAVGLMAHLKGNDILVTAMHDTDVPVRVAAINAWRDVLGQLDAQPVEAMLGDASPVVRAAAATVLGAYGDAAVRPALETLVTSDADADVRSNAAWALGKIGSAESRQALLTASQDKSGLVRGVARAALSTLK